MKTRNFKRTFSVFAVLVMFSVFQFGQVIAAGTPLLLLTYEEIDSEHFAVKMTLSNTSKFAAFDLPVAFDSQNVQICNYNPQTGEFSDIKDGVKTEDEILNGTEGIILAENLKSEDLWDGQILANDEYPYVSNSEGIIKLVMYSMQSKPIFEDSGDFCSIYFKKTGTGTPNIRIATEKNAENYDTASPDGVMFAQAGYALPVEWQYEGDVFEKNSDIVLPNFDDAQYSENDDTSSNSDKLDDSSKNESKKDDNKKDDDKKGDNKDEASDNSDKLIENTELKFVDVDDTYWAKEYIYALAGDKIINGYDDGTFRPQVNITRAELTTLASKAKGFQADDNEVMFVDSEAGAWYNRYLTAGYKNDIISGYPGGEFRPLSNITREDLCVIMYRMYFAEVNSSEYKLTYSDSDNISDYAVAAVKILSEKGILSGRGNNEFAPKAFATRAEVSKVLYSCMNSQ